MVKTICVVQARLTSSRLPNKVLMCLGDSGKTVLEHVYERLSLSQRIDKIIFAIPDSKLNDPLEDFLILHRIPYFRGSEDDVLDRFYNCVLPYNPEVIVRATCDNPCVDWKMADEVIAFAGDYDYVKCNNVPLGTGVEVFTFSSFKKVFEKAETQPQHEHVTPYYYQNPDNFKVGLYEFKKKLSKPYRLTMDTDEDNQVIQEIYYGLYKGEPFTNEQLYNFLESNPSISEKNKDVKQVIVK